MGDQGKLGIAQPLGKETGLVRPASAFSPDLRPHASLQQASQNPERSIEALLAQAPEALKNIETTGMSNLNQTLANFFKAEKDFNRQNQTNLKSPLIQKLFFGGEKISRPLDNGQFQLVEVGSDGRIKKVGQGPTLQGIEMKVFIVSQNPELYTELIKYVEGLPPSPSDQTKLLSRYLYSFQQVLKLHNTN